MFAMLEDFFWKLNIEIPIEIQVLRPRISYAHSLFGWKTQYLE